MLVSIVIITLKPFGDIDCISYLEKQTYQNYEYVIRDDPGVSKAKNEAIKRAKGKIIAFIDDDAVPEKNWLENIVKNLDDEYGIVGKVIHPYNDVWGKIPEHYNQGETPFYTRTGVGCNMAFRKEVFDDIGGFDEYFDWGHEESELFIRFNKKYKLKYCPDVVVTHSYADDILRYMKKRWMFGWNDRHYWRLTGHYPLVGKATKSRKKLRKKQKLNKKTKIEVRIIKLIGWIPELGGIIWSLIFRSKEK